MTASSAAIGAAPEDRADARTVAAPALTPPETTEANSDAQTTDMQTDMQNFRLDEAIEGLRNTSMEMKARSAAEEESRNSRQAAIWDIAVDVQVVLGTLQLTVADLLAMKPDASFSLASTAETPLELVAGGHTIGWCELVAPQGDGDAMSIRITRLHGAAAAPMGKAG